MRQNFSFDFCDELLAEVGGIKGTCSSLWQKTAVTQYISKEKR